MKADAKPLSEQALQLIADRFKVLAEPMRLRLLNALRSGEHSVSELVKATGATQANASKHLGILTECGMLGRRKEGLKVYYFIADELVLKLCELMCSSLQTQLEKKAAHFPARRLNSKSRTPSPDPLPRHRSTP